MSARSKQEVLLLDGGMGHELKLRGISDGTFVAGVLANETPASACSSDGMGTEAAPSGIVESIHHDFLAAGCDVITTNSFVAVPPRMLECGLATDEQGANARAASLIRAAVDRARAAIASYEEEVERNKSSTESGAKRHRIAGCVPPLTECYMASKVPPSANDLALGYKVIISTLLECRVDVLLAETLSTSREAIAILRAYAELDSTMRRHCPPLWISFTIHDDNPSKLRSGEDLGEVCQTVMSESRSLNTPLQALGVNCSAPNAISRAVPILADTLQGTSIKVMAYGNCFQTTTSEWIRSLDSSTAVDVGGDSSSDTCSQANSGESAVDYDEEGYLLPVAYAHYAKEWSDAGVQIIGGCCGCRPAHLCEVARTVQEKPSAGRDWK